MKLKNLLAPYLLNEWIACDQTCKRVYNGFGFGDFDPMIITTKFSHLVGLSPSHFKVKEY